ncbi:MAG: histidine phosphatase family protein [Arenimonas sp.]|nr:histidine phosphatase family protein [Arenimonas sp.]
MTRCWMSAVLGLLLCVGPAAGAAKQTVILVRHGEKAAMPGRDPGLSAMGAARAERLPALLANALPAAVYATEYRRTQQTARPLALAAGVPIRMLPAATRAQELLSRLCALPDGSTAAVVGHSNTVPALVQAWSGEPAEAIADGDYGRIYVVRLENCRVAGVSVLRY